MDAAKTNADEVVEKLEELYMINQVPIKDTNLKLVHSDSNWLNIPYVSEHYNAKYIGEFPIKMKNGSWSNLAGKLFYQTTPHPHGSNYMMLYMHPGSGELFITDGIKSAQNVYDAVVDRQAGVVLYSAYRHDYQTYGSLMADGGCDYIRSNAGNEYVKFTIVDGEVVLVTEDTNGIGLGTTSPETTVRPEAQS